jgi:hypothetical protein
VGTLVASAVVFRGLAAGRPRLARIPAYAIGGVATMWTIERVLAFWRPAA